MGAVTPVGRGAETPGKAIRQDTGNGAGGGLPDLERGGLPRYDAAAVRGSGHTLASLAWAPRGTPRPARTQA